MWTNFVEWSSTTFFNEVTFWPKERRLTMFRKGKKDKRGGGQGWTKKKSKNRDGTWSSHTTKTERQSMNMKRKRYSYVPIAKNRKLNEVSEIRAESINSKEEEQNTASLLRRYHVSIRSRAAYC